MRTLLKHCLTLGADLGLRLAEPGEFTRRAFLNGRLDLAQAEAVADLIDASSEAAAKSAVRSLSGAFSNEVGQLIEQLVDVRVRVEATIDFPEEPDVEALALARARMLLNALIEQLLKTLKRASAGAKLREGFRVVLVGEPNAGKSSLLNALAGDDVAIVSPFAGTTRDRIIQTLELDGYALTIIDTAGLRHTNDPVEQMGIDRTWAAVEDGDLILHVLDYQMALSAQESFDHDIELLQQVQSRLSKTGVPLVHVRNKIDLVANAIDELDGHHAPSCFLVSAKKGWGLDSLRQFLVEQMSQQIGGASETVFLARERHLQALHRADDYLRQAFSVSADDVVAWDVWAELLRLAQQELEQIGGTFSTEDLLGEIFSRFCIGK